MVKKTLVLMQVGSFFECYGLVDKNDEKLNCTIIKFRNSKLYN